MSLVEKICKELGVEIGKEWKASNGKYYWISPKGYLIEVEYTGYNNQNRRLEISNISKVLSGELKPIWEPKTGETYYAPSVINVKSSKGGKVMSLVEKICEELGVEVGEEWGNIDGGTFKIEKDGLFYKDLTNKCWSKPVYSDMYESLLTGELKPAWRPKLGTTYYIPDIFVKGLCIAERWDDLDKDYMYLKRGLVFETEEDAVIMANQILDFIEEERRNE